MRTAIITDTNSGIFPFEGKELGIYVLPMPILIDGKTYYEGENLCPSQFFQYLSERRQISTSQPIIGDVLRLWDELLEEYDDLVYIPMSSGLSSSCHTAQGLAQEYGEKVQVVDNHRIALTQRSSVLDAKALADAGCSAQEIKEELERIAYDSMIYIGVDTLEYLKRSGRITAAGAALSTVLSLKPLLKIEGERLDAYAKVRGSMNCKKRLIEAIQENIELFCNKGWKIEVNTAHSFSNPADGLEWLFMASDILSRNDISNASLSCSIACHVGANAFAMAVSRRLL